MRTPKSRSTGTRSCQVTSRWSPPASTASTPEGPDLADAIDTLLGERVPFEELENLLLKAAVDRAEGRSPGLGLLGQQLV